MLLYGQYPWDETEKLFGRDGRLDSFLVKANLEISLPGEECN